MIAMEYWKYMVFPKKKKKKENVTSFEIYKVFQKNWYHFVI